MNTNFATVMTMIGILASALPAHSQSATAGKTPYDSFMAAFHEVMATKTEPRSVTLEQVEKWTRQANRIRYESVGDYQWKSPREVESSWTGDCKDKALWLFSKLKAAGVEDLNLIIGKKDATSRDYHAWLSVTLSGLTYLLDPTLSGGVWKTTDFGKDEYIPVYSFDDTGACRAAAELRLDPLASPAEERR